MLTKITTVVIPMAINQPFDFMNADVFFVSNKLTPDYQEAINIVHFVIKNTITTFF